jgi:exosortase/archaeosortase family protein
MNSSRLLRMPAFVRLGIRIDTAHDGIWLALLAVALWPTGWWMGQRMVDGSDEPLGLLAIAALLVLLWNCRDRLRAAPRLQWLALALAGVAASSVLLGQVPPLLSSLIGLLALGAGLLAFLPQGVAGAPVLGLSLLSLPLLASLQFYAGYPLRVLTAEASRILLTLAFDAQRSGASLVVDGQLVIVDAPCSGVQMLWLAYFTACVAALYSQMRDRAFLARLPAVSLLVLAGNVLRNTVLVALEASGSHPPGWAHQAIGLAVLAAVCAAIAKVMHQSPGARHV